ncbi:MAG: ABC transporter permease [Alphaproteobacteria bacterium]
MRTFGIVNWQGLYTLTAKEIGRFMKVHAQTISAPVVTALLYYLVFSVAMGDHPSGVEGVGFLQFIAPGLIMMTIAQNAFANTSSSLVIAKVQGSIVDLLMPPLSAGELITGFTVGGIARGLVVGVASAVTLMLLIHMPIHDWFYVMFHAVFGGAMLALVGIIGGIWSDKFDQMAMVQNFIVMPLTFLSGTFFSARQLPEQWQFLCHANPIFYMIDGFRYGFVGAGDSNLHTGVVVVLLTDLVLLVVAYAMFRTGYKLKS